MYDVIVIGGGTAGLGAYRKAKALNKKALIIEAHDFVTTCASVGCMPSKLLIAAAESLAEVNKSYQFGIEVEGVKINDDKLWDRVRSERDRFVGFVKSGAYKIPENDRIIGYAKFISPNKIKVNDQVFESKTFVIATGSSLFIPPIFQDIKEEILTNENIFELKKTPKSVAVFGAGVIGLELGMALHNLGSDITLFNFSDKILKLNKDINNYVVSDIKSKINFVYKDAVYKIEKINNGYQLYYGKQSIWVEKILVATGRRPNINNIDIKNAINEKESIIDLYNEHTTQLGNYPIFLAGDVNNDQPLLHVASEEGVIAGENASLYPNIVSNVRNTPISIVFSSPQIIQVGKTVDLPEDIIKGQVYFDDQGRSRVILKNKGMLNLYYDNDTHLLIGAEMYGYNAEHIAHSLVWLIEKETTLEEMLNFPYYHPVVEEGLRTAVRDAFSKI